MTNRTIYVKISLLGLDVLIVKTAPTIIDIIVALVLIVIVLMQSGRTQGISGAIAGGAETFFGKNKGRTIDGILSKVTSVVAVLFIILSVALSIVLSK